MSAEPVTTMLGTFVHRPGEDRWSWSDELYAIHGLCPTEVIPTTALVEAHCHPDDLASVRDRLATALSGGRPTAGQHRIVDAAGAEHWVAMVVHPREAAGTVWLEGHVVDLTGPHTRSAALLATEMLAAATESRTVIDVAKGVLALAYGTAPDAAFLLLRWYSQHTQLRLRSLAERVVDAATGPAALPPAARHRVDAVLSATLLAEAHRDGGRHAERPATAPGIAAVPDIGSAPAPARDLARDPAPRADEDGLQLDVVHLPGATFVRVGGDVDLRTTPRLTDTLSAAAAATRAPAPVVVDLTEVEVLGPAGVAALRTCHRRCRAGGTELRLVVRADGPAVPTDADGPAVFTDLASAAA